MIKFDASKLIVEYAELKSVTTALKGSITVVDREKSTPECEVYTRIPIPFAVARSFIKRTSITKYFHPIQICILKYDGIVINLERDLANNLLHADSSYVWHPRMIEFVNTWLPKLIGDDEDWYIDGRYIYQLSIEMVSQLRHGGDRVITVSSNNHFRRAVIDCVDLYDSHNSVFPTMGIITEQRDVLALSVGPIFAIAPPIWKNFSAIGSSHVVDSSRATAGEDELDETSGIYIAEERISDLMDQLDKVYAINLNFTIYSAKLISNIFGFDSVDPLNIPHVMVKLQTVNIPLIPSHIRSTIDINLSVSHCIAWLMGLMERTTTLSDYLDIRACMRYLTSKGLFRKRSVDTENIFLTTKLLPDAVPYVSEFSPSDSK